jgi:hypothetical protein
MAASTSFDEIKSIFADLATRQQKFQDELNMERLLREEGTFVERTLANDIGSILLTDDVSDASLD